MSRPSAPTLSRARVVAAALLATAACASTKGGKGAELPEWPLPPDKPRVRFVRAFASEDQLKKGFARSALRVFVPASPDAVVKQPTGLALSPDDRTLFVACASASRLLKVDLAKGKLELFATAEATRAKSPVSVAVDAMGNVYVSDMLENAIFAYDANGKFLRKFGKEKLDRPTGVAIDRRRQVLYVVSGVTGKSLAHRVEVFSLAGQHLRTIGTRGAGPGEFNFPANLGVAKDGSLFVVDMLNFRVQVFDPDGRLVSMFGSIGAGEPGTFDKAKSVGFDSFGNIYVVDSQQAYVQIFNAKFQPLMAFGGRLSLPGFMLTPTAIAITATNTIYVADFFAGLVNEYQLINTTAADAFPTPDDKGAPPATPTASEKPQGG